jgi:hypothetical protein
MKTVKNLKPVKRGGFGRNKTEGIGFRSKPKSKSKRGKTTAHE